MKNILNFFKNKSVGYFIAAGVALFSLIVAIIFFATYRNPDLATQMGNKASGWVVDTIGIFLLAGFIVEVIVLVFPQYRFIHLVAVLMYCLAFAKDICLIIDFFLGIINGVAYNKGNFPLNFFFFFSIVAIVAASVAVAFLGFYKKEEEATADMPIKGTAKIVKVASGAVVLVATILVSSLVSANLTNGGGKKGGKQGGSQASSQTSSVQPRKDPINDRIRQAADAVEYSFNPDSVIIKEKENYAYKAADEKDGAYYNPDYSTLSAGASTREGHNLVYYFEGIFSEGYHGGYDTYSAYLYVWDDGLATGNSNGSKFKGYWYNSSIEFGKDENGADIADCLNIVCKEIKSVNSTTGEVEYQYDNFKSIQTDTVKGFYQRQGFVYINPGWGGRSVVVSGYKYYPDVAMFIDTDGIESFKVGDVFNREMDWAANRVIKNLTYAPIMETNRVTWTYPDGMLDENNKFVAAGEYKIKATWGDFEDEVTIKVA